MSERPVAIGMFREAVMRFGEGKTAVASRLADRARELFLAAGDVDGACAASLLRGRAALRAGRDAEATEWFVWARDEASRRGLEPRVLAATTELAIVAELQGNWRIAVAEHRGVLSVQRTRDDNLGIAMAAGNVARLLPKVSGADPKALAEARKLLNEALERFRLGPHEAGIANSLICIGDLDRQDGKLSEALAAFREVVNLSASPVIQPMRAAAYQNLGHLLRQMGHVEAAIEAYTQSEKIAVALGDLVNQRKFAASLHMTQALQSPLNPAIHALSALANACGDSGDLAGEALLALNLCQVFIAAADVLQARFGLRIAREFFTERGDRGMLDEVELAHANLALMTQSDRLAQKWVRKRGPFSPAVMRQRLLMRATLAFRRLDLRDFDKTLDLLGEPQSWQEGVQLGAMAVERAAWHGHDITQQISPLLELADRHGALVDRLTLQLAQAHALMWLGNLEASADLTKATGLELERLQRKAMETEAMVLYSVMVGRITNARQWGDKTMELEHRETKIPAVLMRLTTALLRGDDAAFAVEIAYLHQTGDERHKAFFFAWRSAMAPPEIAEMGVQQLENAGLTVPPWLKDAAKN